MDENSCPLCNEKVDDLHILDGGWRVGASPQSSRYTHRECLLRAVTGGIGHLEDHDFWCLTMHDPDGGRTHRESALLVDAWVREHGMP